MHFLPDVYVPCDVCKGHRYNRETLEIQFKGKNIHEILGMTVEQAHNFFSAQPVIARKLKTLLDVGLGYITPVSYTHLDVYKRQFFTQYNWKWTFLDLYLQKKGKYLIELYNEEDVFINSRNLELE